MIRIDTKAATRANTASGGGGGSTGNSNVSIIKTGVEGVYLWGHYHDHTADITGNLDYVGDINANGNIMTTGNLSSTNASFSENVTIGGTLDTGYLNAGELQTDNIYNSGVIKTYNLSAVTSYIKDLLGDSITCNNLTVTKAAHFFKLVIDEIKSAQGIFVLSVGNTDLDHVGHPEPNIYRCFFKAKDPDTGEVIFNMFEPYDQVVCQTFNAATGTTYDAYNKFYWMLATSTGTTSTVPIESDSVRQVFVDNFDTDNDGLISLSEFNAVSGVSDLFSGTEITGNFNEMAFLGSLTALDDHAFTNSRLRQIRLPEALKTIGDGCFENCTELSYIGIPTNLDYMGDEVFKNCQQLSEAIILRGTIGDYCFSGCTNLIYLQLPEGLTEITESTLAGCRSIQTLIIPSTVTRISAAAFDQLNDLRRVYMKPTSAPTVVEDTEGNDYYLFENNGLLTDIYIPSGSSYTDFVYPENCTLTPYVYEPMGTGIQLTSPTEDYHFVDLDTNDMDSSSSGIPDKGDSIAVLGNRYDTDRQNALMLGAYNIAWLDPEIQAPFMSQYAGINSYSLTSHRLNVISNGRNEFIGHFKVVVSGGTQDLDEYISENSGFEIVTNSDQVLLMTDRDGYITSLTNAKGLPTTIYVKMGTKRIPILEWNNNSYIRINGNNYPLREGKEE